MVAAIKQQVTVLPGGVIEVRSPELTPGARAEVIVLVEQDFTAAGASPNRPVSEWRHFAGVIDSGDAHSSNNDQIDADLAKNSASYPDAD